jgi:hypothetical protein
MTCEKNIKAIGVYTKSNILILLSEQVKIKQSHKTVGIFKEYGPGKNKDRIRNNCVPAKQTGKNWKLRKPPTREKRKEN